MSAKVKVAVVNDFLVEFTSKTSFCLSVIQPKKYFEKIFESSFDPLTLLADRFKLAIDKSNRFGKYSMLMLT